MFEAPAKLTDPRSLEAVSFYLDVDGFLRSPMVSMALGGFRQAPGPNAMPNTGAFICWNVVPPGREIETPSLEAARFYLDAWGALCSHVVSCALLWFPLCFPVVLCFHMCSHGFLMVFLMLSCIFQLFLGPSKVQDKKSEPRSRKFLS